MDGSAWGASQELAGEMRSAAQKFEVLKREAASREERVAALEAEAGRARATHTQALGDRKVEHKVSLTAQEDGFAQALDTEREKQAALMEAKAVALAEADAKTAEAVERAAEEASAAWEGWLRSSGSSRTS